MGPGEDNERREAWSSYWSSGRLHSCASGDQDNYGGAIAQFWRTFLERLPPPARLLDLATGNGPLPRLVWELHKDAADIDAVDLADVAPAWHSPSLHRGVRFHRSVRLEALPFADASFDGAMSQFGFEYARRAPALAECLRVLRPRAPIALVMHHAGSVLVAVGREELEHHGWLAGDDGLVEAARGVIPWLAQARAGIPAGDAERAARARARYNAAMQALAERAQQSTAPDLLLEARQSMHGLVARVPAGGADATLQSLDAYAGELARARLRTAEMVSHALDAAQLEDLRERLRSARPGQAVDCSELRQAEGVVAWSLVCAPPGGGEASVG